jgi:hypothetical protein
MEIGNTIAKEFMEINQQDKDTIILFVVNFALSHHIKVAVERHREELLPYENDYAYTLKFELTPEKWQEGSIIKVGTLKPKSLKIGCNPKIFVEIELCKSLVEGTDNYIEQWRFWVRTSNLYERAYRTKRWLSFVPNLSFDYEAYLDELMHNLYDSLSGIVSKFEGLWR